MCYNIYMSHSGGASRGCPDDVGQREKSVRNKTKERKGLPDEESIYSD